MTARARVGLRAWARAQRWQALVLGVGVPVALVLGAAAHHVAASALAPDEATVHYRRAVTASMWQVLDANHRASGALSRRRATETRAARTAAVEAALGEVEARVRRAATRLRGVKVPSGHRPVAERLDGVLAGERSYLAAVRRAIEDPSPLNVRSADCAEYELQRRLARLNPLLPGAWKNVSGAAEFLGTGPGRCPP